MNLLDIHCPPADGYRVDAAALAREAEHSLAVLVEKAQAAKMLTAAIANPVDGLTATRQALEKLAGTETAAKTANDVSRVASWRTQVKAAVSTWGGQVDAPEGPSIPPRPQLETDRVPADQFMPLERIEEFKKAFRDVVHTAAEEARLSIEKVLSESDLPFGALSTSLNEALAKEGFEVGAEVLARLEELRKRLIQLEEKDGQLRSLQADIDEGLSALLDLVRKGETLHEGLRSVRKDACREINPSMKACFARVLAGTDTGSVDSLLEDVKTGTGMWSTSLPTIRNSLNRPRVAEAAVRIAEGRPDKLPGDESLREQDEIVEEALRRGKVSQLAKLATTYPDDGLDLCIKDPAGPKPFKELTEGLRALAIKEISFAASSLPVITDQPEDAVPSRAVFETLVPTIREQRRDRQFIFASHDANIVVAGDAEVVWVLGEDEPRLGTLFDESVRSAALELLEGGEEAFALRGRRYHTQ